MLLGYFLCIPLDLSSTSLQNCSSSLGSSAIKQSSTKLVNKIRLVVFVSISELQQIRVVVFSSTPQNRQSGIIALSVLCLWKFTSVGPVIRLAQVLASHLLNRSISAAHLWSCSSSSYFVLSLSKVLLNLGVGYSHCYSGGQLLSRYH